MEPIDVSGSSSASSGNKSGPVTFGGVSFGNQYAASIGGGSSTLLIVAAVVAAIFFFKR